MLTFNCEYGKIENEGEDGEGHSGDGADGEGDTLRGGYTRTVTGRSRGCRRCRSRPSGTCGTRRRCHRRRCPYGSHRGLT